MLDMKRRAFMTLNDRSPSAPRVRDYEFYLLCLSFRDEAGPSGCMAVMLAVRLARPSAVLKFTRVFARRAR